MRQSVSPPLFKRKLPGFPSDSSMAKETDPASCNSVLSHLHLHFLPVYFPDGLRENNKIPGLFKKTGLSSKSPFTIL